MFKETKSTKELHQIRLKHYETTKNMSSTEKAKYINDKAAEAKKNWKKKVENKVPRHSRD
ncbi:MAG: hypothetical protein HQK49_19895 [Oligoflexia bacterium]|nr:hypothetical protein [Oligoflexia bacterium]